MLLQSGGAHVDLLRIDYGQTNALPVHIRRRLVAGIIRYTSVLYTVVLLEAHSRPFVILRRVGTPFRRWGEVYSLRLVILLGVLTGPLRLLFFLFFFLSLFGGFRVCVHEVRVPGGLVFEREDAARLPAEREAREPFDRLGLDHFGLLLVFCFSSVGRRVRRWRWRHEFHLPKELKLLTMSLLSKYIFSVIRH